MKTLVFTQVKVTTNETTNHIYMNYKESYDKVIDAYFKDEIQPYHPRFCVCGNLSNKSENWGRSGYSNPELRKVEAALLVTIHAETVGFIGDPIFVEDHSYGMEGNHLAFYERAQANGGEYEILNHPNYENALFKGMCAALNVLKEIHRSRGEDVDNLPALTKRELCKS